MDLEEVMGLQELEQRKNVLREKQLGSIFLIKLKQDIFGITSQKNLF